jgi:tetratricopeptide (TPR) repeat protein
MSSVASRIAAIGLLLAAASPLGCGSDVEKASEHLANAETYQAEGKEKEALIELRNALRLDPKSAETNFRIGRILEKQQEFADAAFYYGEAYRLDPGRSDATLAQARLLSFPEPERAEALVNEVLAREPDSATAHSLLSHIALVRKDTDAALRHALTASELAPKEAGASHQLGIVHQARIREAREMHKQEPDDAIFEAAIAAFERAAQHGTPRQKAAAVRERGRVLATWPGHEEQADAAFRELVEVTAGSDDAQLRRDGAEAAVVYARRTQNLALLRWSLERLLEADPGEIAVWSQLANLTAREQGPEAGEAVLRRLIEERPKDAEAHIAYARMIIRIHDEQKGIAHLQSVQQSVDEPAAILGFLVDLYYVVRMPDQAAELVDRLEKEHPGSPRTDLARAQRMISEGRHEEGAQLLREMKGRSESADSHYLLALAEFERGRLAEATQAIERALELGAGGDRETAILSLQARIQYAGANWTGLIQTTNTLARMQRSLSNRMRLMRAEALFETGRLELAQRALAYELEKDPPPVEAVLIFARHLGAQDPQRARALLEGAAERTPGNPRVQSALAQMEIAEGQSERALERIDAALAAELPERRSATLHALRAQVLLKLGRLEDAQAAALSAFQAEPRDPKHAELLVAIYAEQGRLDEAIATFEEAREVGSLGSFGEELLARLYTQTQKDDQAIAIYERLVQQGESRVGVKNDLAYLLAKSGRDLDRALELARQAQAEAGENANVADTLGFVYYRKQLYEPALEQFRFAIEAVEKANPPQPAASAAYHYHLGLALRGLDRKEEAIAALEAAVARNPDLTEAKQALAELQGRAGGAPIPQS